MDEQLDEVTLKQATPELKIDDAEETETPSVSEPLIGKMFAEKYMVLNRLGQGGMSTVYKVNDVLLNRVAALKILSPGKLVSDKNVLRLQQEARTASRLADPHIVKIHDFNVRQDGQPYLVMDYIDGLSLTEVLAAEGPLTVERFLAIFIQACKGLAHAHNESVIHRDLKPGNLMISKDADKQDFVTVVDFGIAKFKCEDAELRLTETGEVFGTPYYMSPEQCRGEELDARSDIYSLGCVMYEAISGKVPISAGNALQTLHKHLTDLPEPFSIVCPERKIPASIERVVLKTLAKNVKDRYQSAEELLNELKAIAANTDIKEASTAQTKSAPVPTLPKVPKVLLVLSIIVIVLGAIFISLPNTPRIQLQVIDPPPSSSQQMYEKAKAQLDLGHYAEAKHLYESILPAFAMKDRESYGWVCSELAFCCNKLNQIKEARVYYQRARDVFAPLGKTDRVKEIDKALQNLGK